MAEKTGLSTYRSVWDNLIEPKPILSQLELSLNLLQKYYRLVNEFRGAVSQRASTEGIEIFACSSIFDGKRIVQ